MKQKKITIGMVLLLIPIILAIIYSYIIISHFIKRSKEIGKCTEIVSATVVDIKQEKRYEKNDNSGKPIYSYLYYCTYQFKYGNQDRQVVDRYSNSWHNIGDKVKLRVNPDNPYEWTNDNQLSSHKDSIIFGFIVLFHCLLIIYLYIRYRLKKRKKRKLEEQKDNLEQIDYSTQIDQVLQTNQLDLDQQDHNNSNKKIKIKLVKKDSNNKI